MKYNLFGNTGVLVSKLCLGTMTLGGKGFWEAIGQVEQKNANELVKTAIEQGINFFDTADVYSEGLSEIILGKALKDLGIDRQQVLIATKIKNRMGDGANQVGLSRLHIADAVNDSLQRLGLNHIDILYIHGVDPLTSIEETMRGLEDMVRTGKVRYIGISNHPAWKVVKANDFAKGMGWTTFAAGQFYDSLACRDVEREIIPMAHEEGIAVIPWSPLAGGFLSGKFTRNKQKAGNSRRDIPDFPPMNKEKIFDIIDVLIDIAKTHNVSAAQVALTWLRQKPDVTYYYRGKNKRPATG